MRATSSPACISDLMTASDAEAGPSVQTIFVRGIGEAKIRSGSEEAGNCIRP